MSSRTAARSVCQVGGADSSYSKCGVGGARPPAINSTRPVSPRVMKKMAPGACAKSEDLPHFSRAYRKTRDGSTWAVDVTRDRSEAMRAPWKGGTEHAGCRWHPHSRKHTVPGRGDDPRSPL